MEIPAIEEILPHRDRMKLIHEIVDFDHNMSVTRAKVTSEWPFFNGQTVSPLVLIELVAQTTAINNNLSRIQRDGDNAGKLGFLVGVKKARFFVDSIPLETWIVTRTENNFEFDNLREVIGITRVGPETIAEITLQVISV